MFSQSINTVCKYFSKKHIMPEPGIESALQKNMQLLSQRT